MGLFFIIIFDAVWLFLAAVVMSYCLCSYLCWKTGLHTLSMLISLQLELYTLFIWKPVVWLQKNSYVMSACFICSDVLKYCVHSTGWFITLSFSLLGNLWDLHCRAEGQVQCLPLVCLFLFVFFFFFLPFYLSTCLHDSLIYYISLMAW